MCSGKSNIRMDLEELGVATIDCDKLGHRSYEIGMPAYQKIIETFGVDVLDANKNIDRSKLRSLIKIKENNDKLKEIVWPEIRKLLDSEVASLYSKGHKIIVVEAALLLDGKWHENMNEIWVCFVPNDEAIERALKRNPNLSRDEANALLGSQLSNKTRLSYANVAFCSIWERSVTKRQVLKAWNLMNKRI